MKKDAPTATKKAAAKKSVAAPTKAPSRTPAVAAPAVKKSVPEKAAEPVKAERAGAADPAAKVVHNQTNGNGKSHAAPGPKKEADHQSIWAWENDPDSGLEPAKRTAPVLTLGTLPLEIEGAAPKPGLYSQGTTEFRYWAAADALRRVREFWRAYLPEGANWKGGHPLKVVLDAGEDLNAYYDRQTLSFCRATVKGKTIYTSESADIVAHEVGHAVLDTIRPDLWDAALDEVASFHESFSDLSAMLTAIQLPSVRQAVMRETGGHLYHDSTWSRMAQQLGKALHAINPHAAPAHCLRNAVNLFFYHDPLHLPPTAPETSLSSEPHSFSRIFTGAMVEAMGGMLRVHSSKPTEDDLLQVCQDATKLLVKAARTAALSAAFFSEVAAQVIWAEPEMFQGKYEDVLRSAFVRRGILSLEAARSLKAEALRAQNAKPGALTPDDMPRGRDMMMRASAFGMGEGALVVRTASFSRRGAIAPAALDAGSTPVPGVEQATHSFLETLFRRGRVDFTQAKQGITAVPHFRVRRKTHYVIEQNGQFHLRRRCFDEGWADAWS